MSVHQDFLPRYRGLMISRTEKESGPFAEEVTGAENGSGWDIEDDPSTRYSWVGIFEMLHEDKMDILEGWETLCHAHLNFIYLKQQQALNNLISFSASLVFPHEISFLFKSSLISPFLRICCVRGKASPLPRLL